MKIRKRNVALVGSAALVAALGLGGAMTAQADTGTPAGGSQSETAETSDGPDVGPDADASEPGHQDADESGESGESESGESGDSASDDDTNTGPDADPNEPGHQDAVGDDAAE